MKPSFQRAALPVAGAAAAVSALALATLAYFRPPSLLIAPMMGLDTCLTPTEQNTVDAATAATLAPLCGGPDGSAGALVESTLAGLETPGTARPPFELGYTLNVPLLKLFREDAGGWRIDQPLVDRIARTVRDADRPVIVYLFSTHFSQDAPIEKALSADPSNLSWTQQGPLQDSTYYGAPIYNWSFASSANGITQRRVQAGQAMLDALCRLDPADVDKIRGVTLLGELHHLFPDFEAGMGFERPYVITDYSETSKAGFRAFLQQRFGTIANVNAALGSDWPSFDALEPPSKDIRKEPLKDYTEHIDAYAHGFLPITGWAWVPATPARQARRPARIRVYQNGSFEGYAAINMHRQDVLAAKPEFGTANTGWRYDLDFRDAPAGMHRIDVYLEPPEGGLVHLATRRVAIMDRKQSTPEPRLQTFLPRGRKADPGTQFSVDVPRDQSSYFYNPMVPLWHEFRARQVVRYLQDYNAALQAPCLDRTRRYTHQILPFTNPGWDQTRFAIEASLQPLPGIGLGASLYGEPTYGTSFSHWLQGSGHERYGITEFHPLKALDPAQMRQVLAKHQSDGAEFLSFFMEPRFKGHKTSRHTNLFSFDPDNAAFGSRELYESVRAVLAAGGSRQADSPAPVSGAAEGSRP